MKDLIDRIHSDTKVLNDCIQDTFIKYYGWSLKLTMHICSEKNNQEKECLKNKLVKHDKEFRNVIF